MNHLHEDGHDPLALDPTSTRNLLAVEAAAGVGHHVALSVVGTERLTRSGCFRAKLAQETLVKHAAWRPGRAGSAAHSHS